MDIAELRKKARQVETAHGLAAGQTPTAERQAHREPKRPEAEETAAGLQPGRPEAGLILEDPGTDGLDRLFMLESSIDPAAGEGLDSDLVEAAVAGDDQTGQYLAFHLGQEEYALEIDSISEIIKVREFTDVPRTPGFILGIISLRGVVVPVFDLTARLRLGQAEITTNSRIVICRTGELVVGLLVDSISQVLQLQDDRIEPPPAILSGLDRDFMTGVGRSDGRMVILLNIVNVLDVERN